MKKKLYYCSLCPCEKGCEYGGNKSYDYGFLLGTGEYCRWKKQWTTDMKECPLINKATGKGK